MSWFRRSKLLFDVISRSKITAPKQLLTRNPHSIINCNNQLISRFTTCSNRLISIPKVSSFLARSNITVAKQPPTRNPVSFINHNNNNIQYSSKFTTCSNRPISIPKVSSFLSKYTSSQLRFYRTSHRVHRVVQWPQRRKRWNPDFVFFLVFVGSVVGVTRLFGSYETIPYTERKHFVVITHNLERKLGEYFYKKEKKKYKGKVLPDTHPETVRVRRIINDIIQALHRRKHNEVVKSPTSHLEWLKFDVIVVDSGVVNAFCLPGGKIVVFTGLLNKFKTDEEVATILGHEVAHAVARHSNEIFTMMLWLTIPMTILAEGIDAFIIDKLFNFFIDLPYSRRMEIEADHIGMLLMASAGYDPRGVPNVFKKLGCFPPLLDYIFTHPSGETRSKYLSNASLMQEAISLYEEAIAGREKYHESDETHDLKRKIYFFVSTMVLIAYMVLLF